MMGPLSAACKVQVRDIMGVQSMPLIRGVNLGRTDATTTTAPSPVVPELYMACVRGDLARATTLVENEDADIEVIVYGANVLYWACQEGHIGVVQFLLRAGADVNIKRTICLETPLMVSVRRGYVDIVKMLLSHGADPNTETLSKDIPLITAAHQGRKEIVDALISHGANVNHVKKGSNATALYCAAFKGYADIVVSLLENGADMDVARSDNGHTALYVAAQRQREAVIDVFKAYAGKVQTNKPRTCDGETPLHVAAFMGNLKIVNTLLDMGSDPNIRRCDSGETALHICVREGHTHICSRLIEAGANVNSVCDDGSSPLLVALCCSHKDIAARLIKEGAE